MKQTLTQDLERKKITELARHYSGLGYRVYAELRGFDTPEKFVDVRPDLVVKKGDETVIIEVKTGDSAKRAKDQIERLARYADKVPGTRFDLIITNPRPQSRSSAKLRTLRRKLRTINNGLLTEIHTALSNRNFESVVILSFRLLEGFLAGVAEENDIHIAPGPSALSRMSQALADKKIVSQAVKTLARQLQNSRNVIVHQRQPIVSASEAIDLYRKLISFLRENDRNIDWKFVPRLDLEKYASPGRARTSEVPLPAKTTVVGIGGGGCSTVTRLFRQALPGVRLVAVDTDAGALKRSTIPTQILIGKDITGGLGTKGDPTLGRRATAGIGDQIREVVRDNDLVFLVAGMGGGTGTGATPVIGEMCKKDGILTVGLVSMPFTFEGTQRSSIAENGIAQLTGKVNTLIIVPNDGISPQAAGILEQPDMKNVYVSVDETLASVIRTISETLLSPGLINLDMADLRAVFRDGGQASVLIGHGKGQNRAADAARAAITSPLLRNPLSAAKGVLFSITGPSSLTLLEVNQAAGLFKNAVDPEATIIFGVAHKPEMEDEVRVFGITTAISIDESHAIRADAADRILAQVFGTREHDLPPFLRRVQTLKQ